MYRIKMGRIETVAALLWLLAALCGSAPPDCDGNVDLVFMFDASESVRDADPVGKPFHHWERVKKFARAVTQNLPVGTDSGETRVASLKFATKSTIEFHLSAHTTSIRVQDAMAKMKHSGGNTNAADGFRTARDQLFGRSNRGARQVIVFLSDGLWNVEKEFTSSAVKPMTDKSNPVEIFAVAMSNEMSEANLKSISTSPASKYVFNLHGVQDFKDESLKMAHRICNIPDPTPPPPPKPGSCMADCLECDTLTTCSKCVSGKFFDGTKCTNCMQYCEICSSSNSCDRCYLGWYWDVVLNRCEECEVRADIALLIDDSGSIQDKDQRNYQILKDFIKSLINRLDIGPDTTRVSAIKFSTRSEVVFHLDEHNTKGDLKDAIQKMHYTGGHTNTSGAIRLMRRELFRSDRGDRDDIRNVVLLITDGESTIDSNLTIPEAEMAKNEDAVIFVVGITNMINEDELKNIASTPVVDHYFNSTDIDMLYSLETQIIKHVCRPDNPNTARTRRSLDVLGVDQWLEGQRLSGSANSGSMWTVVLSYVSDIKNSVYKRLFSAS
eukprot:GHVU01079281.1.p1 GENE.GHVU01079281.1~~GHVU01079281.1.p1  ORF type:complete len:553 (-),score=30.11 GHVU01079281.1:425-2083(-)